MGEFERKPDGRRIFTTDFKRQMAERIRSGETTAAVDADKDVVPASRVRDLEKQVKELQRIIAKQAETNPSTVCGLCE